MNDSSFKDYYKILEVSSNASIEVIASAYRALSKKYHPDCQDIDISIMQDINEAYHTLKDADKRLKYDIVYYENITSKNTQYTKTSYIKEEQTVVYKTRPDISIQIPKDWKKQPIKQKKDKKLLASKDLVGLIAIFIAIFLLFYLINSGKTIIQILYNI